MANNSQEEQAANNNDLFVLFYIVTNVVILLVFWCLRTLLQQAANLRHADGRGREETSMIKISFLVIFHCLKLSSKL